MADGRYIGLKQDKGGLGKADQVVLRHTNMQVRSHGIAQMPQDDQIRALEARFGKPEDEASTK